MSGHQPIRTNLVDELEDGVVRDFLVLVAELPERGEPRVGLPQD